MMLRLQLKHKQDVKSLTQMQEKGGFAEKKQRCRQCVIEYDCYLHLKLPPV